jgi:uncharacterized protein (TIGR00251 family)
MPQAGLRILPVEDGATFGVKVVPRASRDELAGIQRGALRVRLTAPPVEGAANRALVEFVAEILGIPKRDVDIVSGHGSRRKVVAVRGLSPREVAARLRAQLPPA